MSDEPIEDTFYRCPVCEKPTAMMFMEPGNNYAPHVDMYHICCQRMSCTEDYHLVSHALRQESAASAIVAFVRWQAAWKELT